MSEWLLSLLGESIRHFGHSLASITVHAATRARQEVESIWTSRKRSSRTSSSRNCPHRPDNSQELGQQEEPDARQSEQR